MRIRWKLLIVLLGLSLVPILVIRWNDQRSMENMGDDLATITRNVLLQKASVELRILVEEHSRVLRRERELIEMALRVQASELEKRFASAHHPNSFRFIAKPNGAGKAAGVKLRQNKYFKVMGNGRYVPLNVSYENLLYRDAAEDGTRANETEKAMQSMVPVYHSIVSAHPDLVFWQLTVLEDGVESVYPAPGQAPMMHVARRTDWYAQARQQAGIVWTRPSIDPFTRRLVFTVAAPLHSSDGVFMGATAIAVPVSALLQEDEHFRYLSDDIALLLVEADQKPAGKGPGIRIVAQEHKIGRKHHHWLTSVPEKWLRSENADALATIFDDLKHQRTGFVEMVHGGVESLVAYGSIDDYGTALLLIVPKDDITSEAALMEATVRQRVKKQVAITGLILAGAVLLVAMAAFVLSHSITASIQKLVNAARGIAKGDFQVRADLRSRDEIGELGRTFDRMIPALEERVRMKQALDVAMEVQQNFLPQQMPSVSGFDIAAASRYCDETGGDFFDFMDFCCRERDTIGIAVGDVSDHGISAALLMSSVRALLRSRVRQPGEITDIIQDVNGLLVKDTAHTGQFVTLFYIELNQRPRKICWVRAGHDPALLYDPTTDRFEELAGEGQALGIDDNFIFAPNSKSELSPGQTIVIGTDGIWEATNEKGEMFGIERLKSLIRENHRLSSDEIIAKVMKAISAFCGAVRPQDDITLVVVKFNDDEISE
jgi:sigma-B regulation protein RsbU (phosphoserine phosphatase)